MKISTAALSFLILAAALGSPTHGFQAYEPRAPERRLKIHQLEPSILQQSGHHHPDDCCYSYTQKFRCIFIVDYFETTSGCSQPGVIFITRRGVHVCANPSDWKVQKCIMKLKLKPKT